MLDVLGSGAGALDADPPGWRDERRRFAASRTVSSLSGTEHHTRGSWSIQADRLHEPLIAVDPQFVAFVRTVQAPLERVARKLTPTGVDPYDIAAEALARTWAHWDELASVANKRAWVLRVAANLAFSAAASEARRRRLLRSIRPGAAGRSFEDDVDDRERLLPALLALPRRQRTAVALRYLADLPLADVAEAMKIGPESAKTHLERGRAALRASLGAGMATEMGDGDE